MGLERINILKKRQGLTNSKLSELSGIPLSTIDKITSGLTTDPKLETVKAITRALGCTLDDLDSEEENDPRMCNLGFKLSNLIQSKKRNINEISESLGVSNQTLYSLIEHKNPRIDIDLLQRLANELDVPLEYFSNVDSKYKIDFKELSNLYGKLDTEDRAEVRGVMKQMLKADKYKEPETEYLLYAARNGNGVGRVTPKSSKEEQEKALKEEFPELFDDME